MIDWGQGRYERTAAELAPVAEHVVSLGEPQPGERVLDLATGTGNAALLAARAGATVTGIDAAPRLIDVARARAAETGVDVSFVVGDVQELPFGDGAFDLALSVFGLIFASDPDRALGEMLRVLRPDGCALLTAWIPDGPIDAMVGVFARAVAALTGPQPARFPWHNPVAVAELAARHGAQARFREARLTVVADSPEAYLEAGEEHPMSLASRPLLERARTAQATREQALAVLRAGNEDPNAFRVSSPYRVIEIRPVMAG
jgi:SAM-dependent methyltransferase